MPRPSRLPRPDAERSLKSLLLKFHASEATDERDKIFALLGLCFQHAVKATLIPSYEKSVQEVVNETLAVLSNTTEMSPAEVASIVSSFRSLTMVYATRDPSFTSQSTEGKCYKFSSATTQFSTSDHFDRFIVERDPLSGGKGTTDTYFAEARRLKEPMHSREFDKRAAGVDCPSHLLQELMTPATSALLRVDRWNVSSSIIFVSVMRDPHRILKILARAHLPHIKKLLEPCEGDIWEKGREFTKRFIKESTTENRIKMLSSLKENHSYLNSKSKKHGSLLYVAASQSDERVLKLLLKMGAEVDDKSDVDTSKSAFQISLVTMPVEVIKLFLDRGADVNRPSDPYFGLTPLQTIMALQSSGRSVPLEAIMPQTSSSTAIPRAWRREGRPKQESQEIVQILLERGARTEYVRDPVPLHLAAESGNFSLIELLLDNNADINATSQMYGSALQVASAGRSSDSITCVEMLLAKGADVNARGGHYGSALHAAADAGNARTLKMLLGKGAELELRNDQGHTALDVASKKGHKHIVKLVLNQGADVNGCRGTGDNYCPLRAASLSNQMAIAKLLLKRGAHVNTESGKRCSPFVAAVDGGHEEMVRFLLDHGANVNANGGTYDSALHAAIYHDNENLVSLLLEKGADVNMQAGNNNNALQTALYRGNENLVSLLLEKGVDVYLQAEKYDNAPQTDTHLRNDPLIKRPLQRGADVDGRGEKYRSALQLASYRCDHALIKLLLDKGANVKAQGRDSFSALQAALSNPRVIEKVLRETVVILLDRGADVNEESGEYGSPLQCAVIKRGCWSVLKLLLKRGANVNAQGGACGNALRAAAVHGRATALELLLQHNADVNAVSEHYGTALEVAVTHQHRMMTRLLLENGADPMAESQETRTALREAIVTSHVKVESSIEKRLLQIL